MIDLSMQNETFHSCLIDTPGFSIHRFEQLDQLSSQDRSTYNIEASFSKR